MGRQVFTAGEILTAASMNDLGDQTVMVFDDATDRATAIPTPVEGMVTYLEDVGGAQGLEVFDGSDFVPVAIEPDPPPAGIGSNAITATMGSSFTTSSGTFVDLTDLEVTITPSTATSRVLIVVSITNIRHTTPNSGCEVELVASAGSTNLLFGQLQTSDPNFAPGNVRVPASGVILHSPGSASAVTYEVRIRRSSGAGTVGATAPAYITAVEVAA